MKISVYPHLHVTHIKNPNRFYAIPIVGIFVKLILILPIAFELFVLGLALFFLSIANSFSVLFNGKNMKTYVDTFSGTLRLITKMQMYVAGLTDRYPGFSLKDDDPHIKIDIPTHSRPNRWFAIPILGGVARALLLIPFIIYTQILRAGAQFGVMISFAPVLFNGKYPETTYELFRDYTRTQLATSAFMGGLEDNYPSFQISKNHLTEKIILIVLGIILSAITAANNARQAQEAKQRELMNQYQQQDFEDYENYRNSDYNDYR